MSYCYLPAAWDAAWQAAKANIATQHASVVGIGDSIMQGWGASDFMVGSWWALMRSQLLANNDSQLGGDHYGLCYSNAVQAALGGPSTASYPLVISGTNGSGWGLNQSGYNYIAFNDNVLSPYVTCTPPYHVIGFGIIYDDYNSGTWTYQVDGGSPITITCTGHGTNAGSIVKKVTITGLSSGSHTLTINATSSGAACNIFGITVYASATGGLCFANHGWPGMGLVQGSSTSTALANTSTFPVDRIALYQGFQGTVASPTALSGFGFPSQPDLAIIAMGYNDAFQNVSRANFRDALDRLVWACRYGKQDQCSVLLMATWCPDGTDASSTTITNNDFQGNTTYYRDIRAAMLEVAQAEVCAFVDVHGAFGRFPVTNGYIVSNTNPHPSNTGHSKIAGLLSAIL